MESLVADVPALRACIGAGAVTLATAAGKLLGLGVHTDLVLLAALAAATAAVVPLRLGLLVAVTAWGMLTGFAVNTGGQLTLHGADLGRLVAFTVVVAAGWAIAPAVNAATRRRPARAVPGAVSRVGMPQGFGSSR